MDADFRPRRRAELPLEVVEAMQEAKAAGLYFQLSPPLARETLLTLYAYNRVVGTVHPERLTLTWPDPDRPVIEDVHPARAVYLIWDDCRRHNTMPEPWQDSWREFVRGAVMSEDWPDAA